MRLLRIGVVLAALASVSCNGGRPRDVERPPGDGPAEGRPRDDGRIDEEAVRALNVGTRYLEQFQYQEAVAAFERALALEPRWTPAAVDLAIAHVNALEPEHGERAVAAARAALETAPDDPRARYVLAYALGERQRDFASALPLLREVVAAAPEDAHSWYQLGRAAHELAGDSPDPASGGGPALREEAERAYRRALELDPMLGEANYRLGRLLLDGGDESRAEEGMRILERHQEIMRGRAAVQQNYLTRGALALAWPYSPPPPRPQPASVALRPGEALPLPPVALAPVTPGLAASRYRAGITVADVDGDGRLDLVAPLREPGHPVVATYRGDGHGFAPSGPGGMAGVACGAAAPGDVERDGDVDLIVACSAGPVLLLNDGTGSFTDASEAAGVAGAGRASLAATWVDVDHDGDLDAHLVAPLAADSDPAAPGWQARQWLLRNVGDATVRFEDVTAALQLDVALESVQVLWSDLDGDNVVDLLASVAGRGPCVLHGSREGRFTVVPVESAPAAAAGAGPPVRHVALHDADADLDLDLVIVAGGRLHLLRNESTPGAPAFVAAGSTDVPASVAGLGIADLDLDGIAEVVLFGEPVGRTSGSVETVRLGSGPALLLRHAGRAGLDHSELAIADLDGDGDPDLATREASGAPVVLWNDLPAGPQWLGLRPVGREQRSNPHGLGARVTVDSGSLRRYVEHQVGRGSLSQVLAPLVFGLGGRAGADGATVVWPSGIRQAEMELAAGRVTEIVELDRQPSSCPMLYGWDGSRFAFLTDCFDTAPAGLWVAPGVHVAGDPHEQLRLRPDWVVPVDGVLNLAIAEFLNESLIADRVALLAVDHEAGRGLVIDEAVRLASPPPPWRAWSLDRPRAPARAVQDGRDVTADLAADDRRVAGWQRSTRHAGIAEPHVLELEFAEGPGVLVLSGALNFPNSTSLFAAHQAGMSLAPPRLEAWSGREWEEVSPDCGAPAGFHKDVVVDLRDRPAGPLTLRVATNLQVSWDRAALWLDAREIQLSEARDVPLLRAEKGWLGIPREVKGPQDRWREFPREGAAGRSDWLPQSGPVTPDGDVRELLAAQDGRHCILRPGEEVRLGFDAAALPPPAAGLERIHVLDTFGWVKDRSPHTAHGESVLPLPVAGRATYP